LDRPGTGGKSAPLNPLQAAADQYRTEDGANERAMNSDQVRHAGAEQTAKRRDDATRMQRSQG
jgi:hypothetical protein